MIKLLALTLVVAACTGAALGQTRIATFNLKDLRSVDLESPEQPRLDALLEVIVALEADILLLNEIQTAGGVNARAIVERLHALVPHRRYSFYWAANNTGLPSGFDLDRNGEIVSDPVSVPASSPEGDPTPLPRRALDYRGDAWGYGTFPGQYGFVLLAGPGFEILTDRVRSFGTLKWRDMPGALRPPATDGSEEFWHSEVAWSMLPLSSRNHCDVPVRFPDGRVIHVLCAHPARPGLDGPEMRNQRRNHDEIRFWRDYLNGEQWIVDDQGAAGGLAQGESFIILGDLNADPERGTGVGNPVADLLRHPRIDTSFTPAGTEGGDGPSIATTEWGLRLDYVLPSTDLRHIDSGVWRRAPPGRASFPSDHWPVFVDFERLTSADKR